MNNILSIFKKTDEDKKLGEVSTDYQQKPKTRQQFLAEQKSAPMAKAQDPLANIIPLGAETRRPNEFVTAGVDAGPGPGRDVLGLPTTADTQVQDLTMLSKYLPLMQSVADSPNSTGTMKAFTKYLKSQIDENI